MDSIRLFREKVWPTNQGRAVRTVSSLLMAQSTTATAAEEDWCC